MLLLLLVVVHLHHRRNTRTTVKICANVKVRWVVKWMGRTGWGGSEVRVHACNGEDGCGCGTELDRETVYSEGCNAVKAGEPKNIEHEDEFDEGRTTMLVLVLVLLLVGRNKKICPLVKELQ